MLPSVDVQRGEPASSQLLPVVVIDPGRTELGAGDPEKLAVPREGSRFEVDTDLPTQSADAAAIDRDEADAAVAADGNVVPPAGVRGPERRDHAPRLQLDARVELPARRRSR